MNITYEVIKETDVDRVRDLCNELMAFQKSKSRIRTELFDGMSFETRMVPSVQSAEHNFIMIAMDGNDTVGYVYSNIASKSVYSSEFATFFDMDSVENDKVGCLSQFYIRDAYRNTGIGSVLFNESMTWLKTFDSVKDLFIFVSNGNDNALKFYQKKGFRISHQILDGFITVLRNS